MRARPATALRALLGAFAVVAGVIACSGIITGPDAGPDTSPRSMRVTPARLELSLADTARMSADLYDVTGAAAVLDPAIRLRFTSADPLIARVDDAGLVTAVADGTTIVTAAYGGFSLGIPVVVLGRPRLMIVSGDAQTAEQGDTLPLPLVVRALDAASLPVANRSVTFRIASGGGALFTVQSLTDVNGLASARWVLGLPLGAQSVAVTSAGSDSALFAATATAGTRPVRVAITAPLTTLAEPGATTTMTAAVFNVANVALPAASVTWTSQSPAVATVSGTGLVTALTPGTAYIRAASGSAADSVLVTVNVPPSIAVAPASLTYAWTVGGAVPAAQAVAVTNGGGGSLNGLSSSITYGAGATGWLSAALNATVAPATLTVTPVPGSTSAGTYTATVRVASSLAGVAPRDIAVTLTVSPPSALPKLQLGADFTHPAGLQVARGLALPSALTGAQSFTLRSLDTEAILLAADAGTLGGSSITENALAGATSVTYWVQGVERSSGTVARLVAEAAGFEPDTIDVTMVRPAARLTLVGPGTVPATGGDEPVLQVTVGRNDGGTLVPMQVRASGVAPTFDVFATDFIALMRFRATGATNGADQGPTVCVSFDLLAGQSATTLPNPTLGEPASLSVVRSGAAGTAGFVLTTLATEYDIIGGNPSLTITALPVPVISVAPASLTFTATVGAGNPPAQQVAITRAGGGTFGGISVSATFGPGASDWFSSLTLGSTDAPTTLTVSLSTGGIPAGTYTASIRVSSSIVGIQPLDIPVTLTVAPPAVLPKLAFDRDPTVPANLMRQDLSLSLPASATAPVNVTLRSVDATAVLIARDLVTLGVQQLVVTIPAGSQGVGYALHGVAGSVGRTVLVIAEAAGYEPDTATVTMDRPRAEVLRSGPQTTVASGGTDPFLMLRIGLDQGEQGVAAMPVRIGGTPEVFVLESENATVAQLRFFATALTQGTDQGPATSITFAFGPGQSTTQSGLNSLQPSVTLARTGALGDVTVRARTPVINDVFVFRDTVGYTLTAYPLAQIGLTPSQLTFNAVAGLASPPAQTVSVANANGGGPIGGLVTYVCATCSGNVQGAPVAWLSSSLDSPNAPAALTVTPNTSALPVGSYTANVIVRSTDYPYEVTAGTVVVTLNVTSGATATQLALTTQPAGAILGVDLATQPVVEVRDAANGLVAGSTAAVTAAITSGDGTLSGTTTVTAVAGVATFTTLRISGARSVDPTITFTSPGLASVAATPLTVAEPVQATFTTQPVSLQVPAGQDASFLVAVSGLPTPTLQWQESTDLGSTYSDIAGETGTTFAVIGVTYPSYRYFRVRATNVLGDRYSQAATLEVLAPPPPCDVGVGSATVVGAPPTVGGAFCPQTSTPPGTPNGAGNVSVGWSETFDYGNGSYFETVSIQFNATTGAVVGVSHYLNDPTRSIISSCSPLPSAPPPCAGVTLDLVNRAVTFTNLVLGNGSPITLNGTLTWPPPPVIGVSPDSIGFTATAGIAGGAAQTVTVSNIGPGTLSGLEATVLYGAGASDWLFASLDANMPATLTVSPQAEFLAPGNYRAIIEIISSVAGVLPETVVVTMTVTAPVTTIALDIAGEDLVGVGLSTTLGVTLGAPAGAGGLTVTVTSDNASMVGVAAPGTVTIAAGQSTGQIILNGLSVGATTVRANAAGYTEGTLAVTATNQIISLPTTLNVPFGLTTSIPIQLATPAPAGGVTVTLTSSDPSRVSVVTTTVTLPQGTTLASGTLSGVAPGAATITATATGWVTDVTTATTTALLNVVETSLGINATFGGAITIELRSGASAIGAPAPGVTVALTAANTACVSVPATVTIPTGQTSVTAAVSYGGIAATPCASIVRATATNMQPDSLNVSVAAPPVITAGGATLGSGLQAPSGASLGASNYGATTMRIESSNPALVLIAPNASTVGSAFIDVPLSAPNTNVSYVIQTLEGVTGAATITASAAGFTAGTANVIVRGIGVEFLSVPASTTTFSPNGIVQARIGTLSAAGNSIETEYAIRTGGVPFTLTVTNSNATVAQLVTTALTSQSVTAVIGVGQTRIPIGAAAGGIEFDPIASGTTTVNVSSPGATTLPGASQNVTVSSPFIAAGGATIGAGLQVAAGASLSASNFGATTMRIESSNPALVLIAPNASTVGSAFLDVPLTAPNTNVSYVIQALEGVTGTATITASAPGFATGTANVIVRGLGVELLSVPATTTTFSPNGVVQARIGTLSAAGNSIESEYAIRFGGTPFTATFTNTNATVAQLVTTALTGQSVTAVIGVGQTRIPIGVAAGGVEFDPIAGGTTTVSVAIPGLTTLPGASRDVTISAPSIAAGGATLGAGLQVQTGASLGASNFGTTTMRIESSNPALVLIAPNTSTVGSAFIDVPMTAPTTSASYVIQALEGVTGTATITASAPGFTSGTATVTVRGLGVELLSVPGTTTSLSPNSAFQARIGTLSAAGNSIESEYAIRAGGTPFTATFTNSNATVAQLATTALTGQSVTATISVGQTRTPVGIATGGVEFDPLSSGTTTVSVAIPGLTSTLGASRDVTISAPSISAGGATLGAGLQVQTGASLGASNFGTTTMRIESSNPALVLIAPNTSTVGSAFIDVPMTAPTTSASYVIQALEGVTGTATITASAPGFTSGTATVTVRVLGVELLSVPGTTTSLSPNSAFQARIGTLSAAGNSIESEYAIRAGGTPFTATFTNSNATVAQLVTTALTGQSVTATIGVGQTRTPSSVGSGGVEFDPLSSGTTTVSVAIPGLTSVAGATRSVTVITPVITAGGATLGSGLQVQTGASLGASDFGALTMRIESSNPALVLIAPNATTAGSAFIDVPLSAPSTNASYVIQALEGVTGTATITVTAPGFTTGTATVTVRGTGLELISVPAATAAAAANSSFQARIGVLNAGGTAIESEYALRTGGVPLAVTVTNSNATAARLVTTALDGQSVTTTIALGQTRSPFGAAAGGVEFDPIAGGTTIVSATAPGVTVVPGSARTVTVTP